MQNSGNPVFIKLQPVNPVTERRHCHKPVTHLIRLRHTIISPQIFYSVVQEFLNRIICRNRLLNESVFIKFIVRKCVHRMKSVQQVFNRFSRRTVTIQIFLSWFVGQMNQVTSAIPHSFSFPVSCGSSTCRKSVYFPDAGVCHPKIFSSFPSFECNHFWRICGSPLGEKMAHLKILNAAASAKIDPAFQFFQTQSDTLLISFQYRGAVLSSAHARQPYQAPV